MDTAPKKKLKLLIVDDIEDVREFMQSYFTRRGFMVFTAGSGEEALALIKEQSPEIMFLDVNLPRMSGIDLLKLARGFNQAIKVAIITGYDTDFQKDPDFQKLNVFDVMRKPVTVETLDAAIEKLLK